MKKWTKSDEAFLRKEGWKFKRGWVINFEEANPNDYEFEYFDKLEDMDFLRRESFWIHPDFEEYEGDRLDAESIIDNLYGSHIDLNGDFYDESFSE